MEYLFNHQSDSLLLCLDFLWDFYFFQSEPLLSDPDPEPLSEDDSDDESFALDFDWVYFFFWAKPSPALSSLPDEPEPSLSELSSSESLAKLYTFFVFCANDLWPPPYLEAGPPLIIATLPALTLAFSAKVSATFWLFLDATSAVLAASNDYWVATVFAASPTCFSNDFLDSSGVSADNSARAPGLWCSLNPKPDPKDFLWSRPPEYWMVLASLTAFFWSSLCWWYLVWSEEVSALLADSAAL